MRKVLLFLLSAVIAVSVCATPASAASVDYMNYEAYLSFDATDVSEQGTVRLSVSMEILDEIEVSDMEFKIKELKIKGFKDKEISVILSTVCGFNKNEVYKKSLEL